jgi:hypothetical protein
MSLHLQRLAVRLVHDALQAHEMLARKSRPGRYWTPSSPAWQTARPYGATSLQGAIGNILHVAQPVSSEPNEWALAVESIAADLADNSGRLNPAAVEDIGVIVHYTVA